MHTDRGTCQHYTCNHGLRESSTGISAALHLHSSARRTHECMHAFLQFNAILMCIQYISLKGIEEHWIIAEMAQSINQSINRSNNRTINQSINRTIKQSIDQSTNQSNNQSIDQSKDSFAFSAQGLHDCLPASTEPVWIPTRISTLERVSSRTALIASTMASPCDSTARRGRPAVLAHHWCSSLRYKEEGEKKTDKMGFDCQFLAEKNFQNWKNKKNERQKKNFVSKKNWRKGQRKKAK